MECLCLARVVIYPPHQSLARQLPPEGKPSLHCANTANMAYMADISNISLSCGLPLRFALVALSCSAKGILQKGVPLGGRWRRRRRMRAKSSFRLPPSKREAALFIAAHLPTHQKLPCTATAARKAKKVFALSAAVAVQGSSGRVREVWRVGRAPFKGSPCASKVFLSPSKHPTKGTRHEA